QEQDTSDMNRQYAKAVLLVLLWCCVPGTASAQIQNCDTVRENIDNYLNTLGKGTPAEVVVRRQQLVNVGDYAKCFAIYLVGANPTAHMTVCADVVKHIESSRTDKKTGPSTNGTASTSVTAQGPVAKALSVATEYGALTQSVFCGHRKRFGNRTLRGY